MGNMGAVVKQLRKERDRVAKQLSGLNAALAAFVGAYGTKPRRKMSAKARARIAAAQRARWKAWKAQQRKAA